MWVPQHSCIIGTTFIASFSSFCEDILDRQHSFVQMYAEFKALAFPLTGFFGSAPEPDKNIKNLLTNFVQRLTAGLRCAWSNEDALLRQRTWVQYLVRRYRVDRLGCTTQRWRWAGGWLVHISRLGAHLAPTLSRSSCSFETKCKSLCCKDPLHTLHKVFHLRHSDY